MDGQDQINADTGEVLPVDDAALKRQADTLMRTETLFGDVRDALLSQFRAAKRPYAQMTEEEQGDLIAAFETTARHVVRNAVMAVTNYQFPRAVVKLGAGQIKDKETIEAKLTCQNIEANRTALGESVGEFVMVLMVDSETFMAAEAEAKPDADQGGLPLDEPKD